MGLGRVNGLPSRDELEKNDPEAVNVGLECELAGHGVVGGAIAVRSHDPRRDVGFVSARTHFRKPKIRQLWVIAFAEQNVGAFLRADTLSLSPPPPLSSSSCSNQVLLFPAKDLKKTK